MIRRLRLNPRDWLLLAVMAVLLAVGTAFVRSASYRSGPMGEGYYTTSPFKQVQWVIIGAVLFVAVLAVNYRHLIEHAYLLYAVGLGALVLVLFFGVTNESISARRWLPFGPVRVQPSEFMKIVAILVLARYLMYRETHRELIGLAAPFGLALVPMALIAKEPDLGTALVLLPVVFAMLYVAAARGRQLLLIVGLMVLSLPVLWFGMHPYQRERVIAFLAQDDEHTRYRQYQLDQSKVAIGSGGVFGKGLEKGTQGRWGYIPPKTRNNDFIFAIICEEWGFVGANFVLALYLLLLALCARVAEEVHHPGGRLIVVGVLSLLGTEVIVNTAMATGQIPIVGLTLPLISYGGSSLLSSFIGLALVLNVSLYKNVAVAGETFDPEAAARRETAPMPEETFMH